MPNRCWRAGYEETRKSGSGGRPSKIVVSYDLRNVNGRLDSALQAVDRSHFCLDDQGRQLPQTSAPEVIVRMLQLLDVQLGDRVLEIGTGSGYSTALLAELTGPSGTIVSIDVDPEMAQRATRLLRDAGYDNVSVVTADGAKGCAAH